MVVSVVVLAGRANDTVTADSGDDAARPAVVESLGGDGVFAVVAFLLLGQAFFEISKGAAVFVRIRKWPATLN